MKETVSEGFCRLLVEEVGEDVVEEDVDLVPNLGIVVSFGRGNGGRLGC